MTQGNPGDQAFELSAAQRAAFARAGGTGGAGGAGGAGGTVPLVRVQVDAVAELTGGELARRLGALAGRVEILRTRFERPPGVTVPLQVVAAEPALTGSADGVLLGSGDIRTPQDAQLGARVTDGRLELWASETLADHESLAHLADLLTGRAELEDDPLQYADFAGWEAEQVAESSPEQRLGAAFWAPTTGSGDSVGSGTGVGSGTAGGPVAIARVAAPTDDPARWLLAWVEALRRNGLLDLGEAELGVRIAGRPGGELAAAIGPFARDVSLRVASAAGTAAAQAVSELAVTLADAERFAVFAPDDVGCAVRMRWLPAGAVVAGTDALPDGVLAELTVVAGGPASVTVRSVATPAVRLAAHVATLVHALATDPDRPVAGLPMLTADELHELATAGTAEPVAAPGDSLLAAFDRAVAAHPQRIAVRDGQGALRYDELAARVAAVAAGLQSRGYGDRPVAVLVDRSVATVVALLAAVRCGVPFVPLRADLPATRRRALVEKAGAGVVLGTAADEDDGLPHVTVAELEGTAASPAPAAAGDVLYMMATSGSTGTPKLVEVTAANASAYADAVTERLGLGDGCVLGVATSLATDLAYTMLFPAWLRAGTVVLLDDVVVTDATALDRVIAEAGIDAVKLTPSLLRALLAGAGAALRVPLLVLGGEALTYADVARARAAGAARVVNHFGPTETTVGATTHEVAGDVGEDCTGAVPIGRPLPGVRVAVLDAAAQPTPAGVVGELAIAGAGVSNGYRGDAAQTASAFVPAWDGTGVMYLTGDRVRWDDAGRLVFHGRADGQVKIRGYRVELGEIEQALRALPGVVDSAVLVDPADPEADRLLAWVATANRTPSELHAELAAALPAYMVPGAIAIMPTLPRMPNGKLDASALPAPTDAMATGVTPPATETERTLLAMWEDVLAVGAFGVEDDFFYLGGHSLIATRIIARARSAFGVELPLHVIFTSPTVRAMAAEIDERRVGVSGTPDDPDGLLALLESMSETEAQALLDAELGKPLRPE